MTDKKDYHKVKTVTLRFTPEQLERLNVLVDETGTSRNELMKQALEPLLDKYYG